MKIQKEIWAVASAIGFLIPYLIDKIAGPVLISIGSPVAFLKSPILLQTYPLTTTAIVIRTLSIFVSVMLAISFLPKKYFIKAAVLFFVGILAEFFAIQQLATGFRVTTIQWTLSIAYGSLTLILGIVWFVLKGIWSMFGGKEASSHGSPSNEEKSILDPPREE
jgi:hypothetical protein